MTQEQQDIVKVLFAAFCIVEALAGVGLSFLASSFADSAIPEDKCVLNEQGDQQMNREAFEYVDRLVSLKQARWATIFGQALLFISLISGLVINFPWWYGIGISVWVVTLAVALYFAGWPFAAVRRLRAYRKRLESRVKGGFFPLKVMIQPEIAYVLGLSPAEWKTLEAKMIAVDQGEAPAAPQPPPAQP